MTWDDYVQAETVRKYAKYDGLPDGAVVTVAREPEPASEAEPERSEPVEPPPIIPWQGASQELVARARTLEDRGYVRPGTAAALAGRPEAAPPEPEGIDAVDLLALQLDPLRMVVPDLLPEGTVILAAPPKVGKSCLVYQLVVEVAIGGELLGRRVAPGSCLYLALEDGRRRGQDRLRTALAGRTLPRGRLEIRWSARRIGEGLEQDLVAWLDAHPDAAVVAIDTLQKVRPRSSGKRGAYEVDVDDLGRLQATFRDRRVALVIVHHARKEASDDFVQSVSGTYGVTGSADAILVIRRKRLEAFGMLLTTGRDIPDAEVSVRFDEGRWTLAPEMLAQASFERAEVFKAIETAGRPIFPAAIAANLGMERTSVQHMVEKLVERGAVARTKGGYIAVGPALARAYESLPTHSSHWGSEQSAGGYKEGASDPELAGDDDAPPVGWTEVAG